MAKNLIIYYSRKGENYVNGRIENLKKGNTEICAEYIQKAVGGDLFEIQTVEDYSKDYHTCTEEAAQEVKVNARPKLTQYLDNTPLRKWIPQSVMLCLQIRPHRLTGKK